MAKITKVPNGPLIKKNGPFKGSTLKSGGKIKKAQGGMGSMMGMMGGGGGSGDDDKKKAEAQAKANANMIKGAIGNARSLYQNQQKLNAKSGGAIKKAASGLTTTRETTIDPKLKITRDSIKNEKRKIIWKKSYDSSEGKKKGQDFDTWYREFDQKTKENSKKAPEPRGERTFFGGDNGPKSPCKGGKCSGLNSSSRNGSTIKKAKAGAMIKRADGSMSRRGLWDNIRKNKGSGKKPTKQMLVQEKKIKAKSKK